LRWQLGGVEITGRVDVEVVGRRIEFRVERRQPFSSCAVRIRRSWRRGSKDRRGDPERAARSRRIGDDGVVELIEYCSRNRTHDMANSPSRDHSNGELAVDFRR